MPNWKWATVDINLVNVTIFFVKTDQETYALMIFFRFDVLHAEVVEQGRIQMPRPQKSSTIGLKSAIKGWSASI